LKKGKCLPRSLVNILTERIWFVNSFAQKRKKSKTTTFFAEFVQKCARKEIKSKKTFMKYAEISKKYLKNIFFVI